MQIQRRSPLTSTILAFVTFGIYGIYWIAKTKGEINSLGAQIPTTWLVFIPIANIYYFYKYAEGFATYVLKDSKNTILWFILYLVIAPVAMILVQMELNKLVDAGAGGAAPAIAR